MTKRYYRLPNGDTTSYVKVYTDAWDLLVKEAERYLPGYTVYGYDPDLALHKTQTMKDGRYRVLDRVSLSFHALAALRQTFQKLSENQPNKETPK